MTGRLFALPVPHALSFPITGYTFAGSHTVSGAGITDVGVDGSDVTQDGASIEVNDMARATLAKVHANGQPATLLVSNYDNAIQDFSPKLAAKLLRNAGNRASVAAALAKEAVDGGWDGITIDLETLRAKDRAGLVAFTTAVRQALPAGKTLAIDVPAVTTPDDEQWDPLDLTALAQVTDHLVVMAYDQHYQGGSPGAIAGLPWVAQVLQAALAKIPRDKLRMGIAGFGYRWKPGGPDVEISDKRARQLAGKRAKWSPKQHEWYAHLADGSTLWWSDARSMKERLGLFEGAGVAGAALWRLGAADQLTP